MGKEISVSKEVGDTYLQMDSVYLGSSQVYNREVAWVFERWMLAMDIAQVGYENFCVIACQ